MAKKATEPKFKFDATATEIKEVTGYKKKDIIQINGANPSQLHYAKDEKNLIITVNNLTLNVVNYFKTKSKKRIDTVRTIGADGTPVDIKISTDANINYTSTNENETFNFGKGIGTIDFVTNFGDDTVVLNKGERVNLTFTDNQFRYEIKGKDVVVTAMKDETVSGTVKLKNFAGKDTGATVFLNGSNIKDLKGFKDMLIFEADDVNKKGKLKTTALDDTIRLANYMSTSAKGATVDAGAGNDYIVGSKFNDTIKTSKGNNTIVEQSGINKITTGKGNDKFDLSDGADGCSSNTIKSSGGDNIVEIKNSGTNKVTLGAGTDKIYIDNGTNTVNAGSSITKKEIQKIQELQMEGKIEPYSIFPQQFDVLGGVNTITSGKGFDFYEISGGYNTINSGADGDQFELKGGVNNINAGAGDDAIWIHSGTNIIQGGAGNDAYHISKPSNNELVPIPGNTVINDSKGNEIYNINLENVNVNITDKSGNDHYSVKYLNSDVTITDKKGRDELDIHEHVNNMSLFFNVDRKKGAVGDLNIINTISTSYDADDNSYVSVDDYNNIDFNSGIHLTNYFSKKGKIETIKAIISDDSTHVDVSDGMESWIDSIQTNVQSWLADKNYKNTMAVFDSGDKEAIASLMTCYTKTFADVGNIDDSQINWD